MLGGQRGTASWCLGEGEAPPPPVRNALHLQSLRGSRGEEAASRPRARLSGCPSRSRGVFVREALRGGRTRPTSLPAEAPPSAQRRAAPLGTCPRLRDHRSHFGAMLGPPVSARRSGRVSAPGRRGPPPSVRPGPPRGARAPRTRGGRRGARAPSQALAARGAAARPAHAHAHRAPAAHADPGSGRRRRGASGPPRGRAPGCPRAARGRGGRAGAGVVSTHPPGGGAGRGAWGGALGAGARGGARAPPPRGAERGLSRRSGRWWPASCWRCRRAGRGAPRGRAGGRRGRGAARTGPRSSWSSCTGGWRPACSAPSTTRCSWARASRRATPAARPGAGPPTAASGRPPTCAACRPGPTGERARRGARGGAGGAGPSAAPSRRGRAAPSEGPASSVHLSGLSDARFSSTCALLGTWLSGVHAAEPGELSLIVRGLCAGGLCGV